MSLNESVTIKKVNNGKNVKISTEQRYKTTLI